MKKTSIIQRFAKVMDTVFRYGSLTQTPFASPAGSSAADIGLDSGAFTRRSILYPLLLQTSLICALCVLSGAAHAGSFDKYERGALSVFNPPDARMRVLPNGIKCFLLEDHALPMVKIKVISKTGGIYDPADKAGLAALAGILMRSGGAGGLAPEDFDSAADSIGAALSSSIGQEMGEAELTVLSSDLQEGLGLFFDMIFKPGFDPVRLGTARSKIEETLRRDNDNPDSLAAWRFRQLLYGSKSPWARRPGKLSLSKISVRDVKIFHENYFRPGNLIIAAAGDFKSEEFARLIEKLTAGAPGGGASFPNVEEVAYEFKPAVEEVIRPLTQSFIRMGHLGIKRHNPDKFALLIMNDILGAGNFKSRLMEDVRTKRGMAYSIRSDLNPATDYGAFFVAVDTKSAQAGVVIDLIRGEIARLGEDGIVSAGELEFARQSILSRLVFEFDTPFKTVDHRATYHFYGYPDNYWRIYRDKMAKVSAKDVSYVAKKYLHPEGLKIVVVGPKVGGLK